MLNLSASGNYMFMCISNEQCIFCCDLNWQRSGSEDRVMHMCRACVNTSICVHLSLSDLGDTLMLVLIIICVHVTVLEVLGLNVWMGTILSYND